MWHYLVFSAFFICYVHPARSSNYGPAYPPTKGKVWPKPQLETKDRIYYKLTPAAFKFTEVGQTCDILKNAIERYTLVLRKTHHIAWKYSKKTKQVSPQPAPTDPDYNGTLEQLLINLTMPCEDYPHMDMDEKYSLNVSAVSNLNADSIWGILRGLETFVQLFYMANGYKDVLINATQIIDYPRYPYRGLLIDTSRHYLSVSNILKTLEAMEMNKMNVLHWHIVDDQSFPYQSKKFPELSELGAYHPSMVYTATDIKKILASARGRGIRVIPEFDMPGHTRSWGEAYPGILASCYKGGKAIGLGPMDPTSNVTYKLIRDLLNEVQERFPDQYLHLGGDEVNLSCWSSNPGLQEFMKTHNMSNVKQLHAYFMSQVIPLLGENTKPIVWQEVFDEGVDLPSDTIIQLWKNIGPKDMIRILSTGHKVIYSSAWYLDHVDSGGDWTKFYILDPRQMVVGQIVVGQQVNTDDIVGGTSCMWGEVVDDNNVISRVWPRASAMAEVLWTSSEPGYRYSHGTEIMRRLEEQTCRMILRGIEAQPPNGPGFCLTGP